MSHYKKYFLKQFGIEESLKSSPIQPSDVDPKELEMGVDDEAEHTDNKADRQTIALQHLKNDPKYYTKAKSAGLEEAGQMMSPTVRNPAVIAMAVRGSSTGGLPSGADREMELSNQDGIDVSNLESSQLGGYEPITISKHNSKLINKTPKNSKIDSNLISNSGDSQSDEEHPHQTQNSSGEPPQEVTGASTEDSPLMLKMGLPKGLSIDLEESGNTNNPSNLDRREKDPEQFNKRMGMDETFNRHIKLMNESINEVNHTTDKDGKSAIAVGAPGSKIRKAMETGEGCCDDCKAGRPCTCDDKKPDDVKETYSPPFAKMRGLANLGDRKVAKNGLWETTVNPGESTPQKWHMDKKRAGMVPDKMLKSIKERLSLKSSLNEVETEVLKTIDEIFQKRATK